MVQQLGHYGPADLRYLIEHQGLELLEVDDFSYDFDPQVETAGAGLGFQKDTYHKIVGAPKGTGKIKRKWMSRGDNGNLFLDLARGSSYIITEPIAAAATTYTVSLNTALASILELRNTVSNVVLREGLDYTVNYSTGVITLAAAASDILQVRYLATSRRLRQFLVNGSFEDALTNVWVLFGTATIARDTTAANVYTDTYGLKVTPSVANDGVQYNLPLYLEVGRQYRLRGYAKAAAAETLVGYWYDGTSDQAMTVVSGGTLTTTWAAFEMTFTPTKSLITNLKIKDTKASPGIFYLDNLALLDDTTGTSPNLGNNPMDNGLSLSPFEFNVVARRVVDGVAVLKLMDCALDKLSGKSGKEYTEDVSFKFLDISSE